MTRFTSLATVSAAALLVSGSMAFAQCVDTETTASTNGATASDPASPEVAKRMEGVAKDGSQAPMEAAPDSTQQQAQSGTTTRSMESGNDQQAARDATTQPNGAGNDQQASSDTVQKDGSNMPLAQSNSDQSGDEIATSQQDVEAQQQGEQTMAARTDPDC